MEGIKLVLERQMKRKDGIFPFDFQLETQSNASVSQRSFML